MNAAMPPESAVARPDIIAEVDEHGAKLMIAQGESVAIARPTPQGALDLAAWLQTWARAQSSPAS